MSPSNLKDYVFYRYFTWLRQSRMHEYGVAVLVQGFLFQDGLLASFRKLCKSLEMKVWFDNSKFVYHEHSPNIFRCIVSVQLRVLLSKAKLVNLVSNNVRF